MPEWKIERWESVKRLRVFTVDDAKDKAEAMRKVIREDYSYSEVVEEKDPSGWEWVKIEKVE